jgi:hypothetical protein
MRSTQRLAHVDVEAGEPWQQSLMHDVRPASCVADDMEAGELRGTRFM